MIGLILVRHAHAVSNLDDVVNGVPPGLGLSETGIAEAQALARLLASEPVDLGVSSSFLRARETLALALSERTVPSVVEPLLDEIRFGSFEGGTLGEYRAWAWATGPEVQAPGGGEARTDTASRLADGLDALLRRPEKVVLAVSHGLPVRYVLDAADGRSPAQRLRGVPHATSYRLDRAAVEKAALTLREWAARPSFEVSSAP